MPTQVESIEVSLTQKTITWTAPAEPNGIIVGYRVQYWELGRRDTTEEGNTTAEELVFSYNNFSKCSTAHTTLIYCKSQFKHPSMKSHSEDTVILSLHTPQVQVYLTRCKFKLPL